MSASPMPIASRSILSRHFFSSGARFLLTLAALALFFAPLTADCAASGSVVTAYIYPRANAIAPGEIDASMLTRINYAFANIHKGRIVEGEPVDAANFATLHALKKDNPQLTVLVSVGGWVWSGAFSDVALTPASRAHFIDSVAAFVTRYQLDGLDVDWEYPGLVGAGHKFRPVDKQNYTLLLKELRTRFDSMAKENHHRLYITIATGASSEFLDHTEMSKVERYVDTVNLMTYDYYEAPEDRITGNHAPLFANPADPKAVSVEETVLEYEKAGVPAGKLLLGVPFYGHVWGHVLPVNKGLFQRGAHVPNDYANYATITATMLGHGYIRYWDAAASVPYLYNADKRIFVSYEDSESLALKCRFALQHHLAGMMFWDYESDPSGTLLGAMDAGLRGDSKTHAGRKISVR